MKTSGRKFKVEEEQGRWIRIRGTKEWEQEKEKKGKMILKKIEMKIITSLLKN